MGLFKKMVLGGLVATGAIMAFKGTYALNHARQEATSIVTWAESKVPMEKKFSILRREVSQLDGEVERVKTELAREIVETRELTVMTAKLKAKVAADKAELLTRAETIKDAETKGIVKVGHLEMSAEKAITRLARDKDAHLQDRSRLDLFETTLAHRVENRDVLQQTLNALVGQKDELLMEINQIESDYKRLQLAQVQSKFQTDDSKLAHVKERLRELKKQVEIKKVRHDMEPIGKDTPAAPVQNVDDILQDLNK